MRTGSSPTARNVGVALALATALTLLAGCDELLNEPAPGGAATITLTQSLASPQVTGDTEAAFGKVDRILVRLTPIETGPPVVDEIFSVSQEDGEIRVELEVELTGGAESFDLFLELRRGQDPLFRGETTLELRPGVRAPANVNLDPIPAALAVPSDPPPLTFVGETVQLDGAVLFATGDVISGLEPTWSSQNPAVAAVDEGGLVTAVAEGDANIQASLGDLAETVLVRVRLAPAEVQVEPSESDILVGQDVQLEATVRDAGGTVLDRTVVWSSLDPSVASVDQEGRVTGESIGTATIRAETDGVHGDALVHVDAVLPTAVTLSAANVGQSSAVLRGDVNPSGSPTEVWFEWGLTPDLSDGRTTGSVNLSGGTSTSRVQRTLGNLEPDTEHYYRVVAQNAAGTVVGEIVSFTTLEFLPAPTQLSAVQDGIVFIDWFYDLETYSGVFFEVERRVYPSGPWAQITVTESTRAEDPVDSSDIGTTYGYRVRACRPTHCSAYSAEDTVTVEDHFTERAGLAPSASTRSAPSRRAFRFFNGLLRPPVPEASRMGTMSGGRHRRTRACRPTHCSAYSNEDRVSIQTF